MKFPIRRDQSSSVPRRRFADIETTSDPAQRSYLRNRTLSGMQPTREESVRGQAHALVAQRRRLSGIFLLIFGVIIVLALILGQFTAKVSVGIVGTKLSQQPDTQAYATAISNYLNGNPVERLRFSLSNGQLLNSLSATDPEIASIKQTTTWGFCTTNFAITLRQPVAGWQINHQQYYVDATGVAFQKNYSANPSVQIVDQSGATPGGSSSGGTVTSTRFLAFIGKIVSVAQGRGYTITQAVLPAGTTREVAIHIANLQPEVRLSIDRGAGEQVEDMDRSIKYLTGKGITPQYIDVRIAGKAYYQ